MRIHGSTILYIWTLSKTWFLSSLVFKYLSFFSVFITAHNLISIKVVTYFFFLVLSLSSTYSLYLHQGYHAFPSFLYCHFFHVFLLIRIKVMTHFFLSYFVTFFHLLPFVIIKVIEHFSLSFFFIIV